MAEVWSSEHNKLTLPLPGLLHAPSPHCEQDRFDHHNRTPVLLVGTKKHSPAAMLTRDRGGNSLLGVCLTAAQGPSRAGQSRSLIRIMPEGIIPGIVAGLQARSCKTALSSPSLPFLPSSDWCVVAHPDFAIFGTAIYCGIL